MLNVIQLWFLVKHYFIWLSENDAILLLCIPNL